VEAGEPGKLEEFLRSLKGSKPDVIFVEVRGFREIAEVLEPLLAVDPMLPVLIYCRTIENHAFLELHRLGFGDRILHLPCSRASLEKALQELRSRRDRVFVPPAELCPVVSFFPGKPGSGASTAAWHFANICAEILGEKVALIDLDLNCGVQSLFAGVQSGMNLFDVISIVDHTGQMPDSHHLPKYNGVELLSALRRCRSSRIDSKLFENFLTVVRGAYRLTVVDHSGNWERYSVEAMKASAVIYCVCESEILSLALAGRASSLLAEEGLSPRTRLVLNRNSSRYALPPEEAERLSALRIVADLPNCYGELWRSATQGYLAGRQTAYFEAVKSLAADTLWSLRMIGNEEADKSRAETRTGGWLQSLGLMRGRSSPAPLSGARH
jgi:MinD-like ATPase involved in chromosome partitioning or flagellar assembly